MRFSSIYNNVYSSSIIIACYKVLFFIIYFLFPWPLKFGHRMSKLMTCGMDFACVSSCSIIVRDISEINVIYFKIFKIWEIFYLQVYALMLHLQLAMPNGLGPVYVQNWLISRRDDMIIELMMRIAISL